MFVHLDYRAFLTITGDDRYDFLQGLITNDIHKVKQGLVYSCLLTPQGKYLFDFFIFENNDTLIIDCFLDDVHALFKKLRMFTLRSQVTLTVDENLYSVYASEDQDSAILCFKDPRHTDMGYRLYSTQDREIKDTISTYHKKRYGLVLPEGADEMIRQKTTMLEANMDVIGAVDFDKGCYMGQELTARTHYRGLVKKRYMSFTIDGNTTPEIGAQIHNEAGKMIGDIRAVSDVNGLALMRLASEPAGKSFTLDNGTVIKF